MLLACGRGAVRPGTAALVPFATAVPPVHAAHRAVFPVSGRARLCACRSRSQAQDEKAAHDEQHHEGLHGHQDEQGMGEIAGAEQTDGDPQPAEPRRQQAQALGEPVVRGCTPLAVACFAAGLGCDCAREAQTLRSFGHNERQGPGSWRDARD